jgi:hypothetical protein
MPVNKARATIEWPMLSFVQVRERQDRADVVVIDAVAGVDDQPVAVGELAARAQAFQLGGGRRGFPGVGEGARVELDDRGADGDRGFDLRRVGTDEERDLDAGGLERVGRLLDAGELPGDVEAAFGRDLFARFGDEADRGRAELQGEGGHRGRAGHLQVEAYAREGGDRMDIGVLDVAAILAQVQR